MLYGTGANTPYCLFVENEIGVPARISGLFSGKSYNLDSLTVGVAMIDYDGATVLLECTQTENRNDDLIALLKRKFANRLESVVSESR